MSSRTKISDWLIPSAAALVGALAGLIVTLLTTGYLEESKLAEQRQSEAVAAYIEAAWGDSSAEDESDFVRKLSLLSVYASKDVVEKVRGYGISGCVESSDTEPKCKQLWVSIVVALRSLVGSEPVPDDTLRELLWGN